MRTPSAEQVMHQINRPVTFGNFEWSSLSMSEKINLINKLGLRRSNECVEKKRKTASKNTKKRKKKPSVTEATLSFIDNLPASFKKGLI